MKALLVATASVLALSVGIANAQTTAPTTSPSTTSPSTTSPSTTSQSPQSSQAMNLSKTQIEEVQQQLKNAGLYKGTIDGEMGPETKQAVQQFQQQKGLPPSGNVDQQTLQAINSGSSAGPPTGQPTGQSGTAPAPGNIPSSTTNPPKTR